MAENINPRKIQVTVIRSGSSDLKTLTLRISAEVHEQIEKAAKAREQSLNQFITEAALEATRAISNEGGPSGSPLAIFVDLDSFGGRPLINLEAIERVAKTIGRPVIKCSFSTKGAVASDPSRKALLDRNFDCAEMVSREALRLRFATDAFEMFTERKIEHFVIVSGDEEFGLVSWLLTRKGAKVVGIGTRSSEQTSPTFMRAFEAFRFYDQIASPPESNELQRLRARYSELLCQAALELETRGTKAVGAALIRSIRDRHPEMSLELLELRNWRELGEIARELGLIAKLEPSGVDFLVQLSEAGQAKAEALRRTSLEKSAQVGEIETVRSAITEILGVELPDVSTRFLIFNSVQWVFNEEMVPNGIPLIDLSYRVASHIALSGIHQNTVYRLVNGLYRIGAFDFLVNQENEFNPWILHARISVLRFDEAFLMNLMRNRRKFPFHVNPEIISEVVYGTPAQEEKIRAMLKLATDTQFGRGNLVELLTKLGAPPNVPPK